MGGFTLLLGLAVVAAALETVSAGAFEPMGLHRAARSFLAPNKSPSQMTEDELFNVFFKDPSYLLKAEEANPQEDDEHENESVEERGEDHDEEEDDHYDDIVGANRGLVRVGNDDDDDYLDDFDVGGRSIGSFGKQAITQIGKVGLNMRKSGLKVLKSVFYKFGGKRLFKRAKNYLKNNVFGIDPISCVGATCESCAVFNLPFKVKSFKACAEMGFKRNRGRTNFTVNFNVVNNNMFEREFEVGDLSNCYQFDKDPMSLASLVGKVCLQGFEFKIESLKNGATKRKGKFCLALVFKRWATGFRFCVERKDKKENKATGPRRNEDEEPDNETQKSTGQMEDAKNKDLVWKVTLKKIAAGEHEYQIVSDKPLFKGESQKRKEEAAKVLGDE